MATHSNCATIKTIAFVALMTAAAGCSHSTPVVGDGNNGDGDNPLSPEGQADRNIATENPGAQSPVDRPVASITYLRRSVIVIRFERCTTPRSTLPALNPTIVASS